MLTFFPSVAWLLRLTHWLFPLQDSKMRPLSLGVNVPEFDGDSSLPCTTAFRNKVSFTRHSCSVILHWTIRPVTHYVSSVLWLQKSWCLVGIMFSVCHKTEHTGWWTTQVKVFGPTSAVADPRTPMSVRGPFAHWVTAFCAIQQRRPGVARVSHCQTSETRFSENRQHVQSAGGRAVARLTRQCSVVVTVDPNSHSCRVVVWVQITVTE